MKDNFEINIDDTINSGQVFLWEKYNSKWYGINGEKIIILGDKLNMKSASNLHLKSESTIDMDATTIDMDATTEVDIDSALINLN